jgi:uncharacterized glyoxalase superfamily protein PhnB
MSRFQPDGWPTVIPRIVISDVRGLTEFVRAVFDAVGEYRIGGPTELKIGDSIVMVSGEDEREAVPAFLYVYVADADETYRRAIGLGARSIEEPRNTPYGDRRAMVQDSWGNTWQIATHRPPGAS